jgi:hypothetical protein
VLVAGAVSILSGSLVENGSILVCKLIVLGDIVRLTAGSSGDFTSTFWVLTDGSGSVMLSSTFISVALFLSLLFLINSVSMFFMTLDEFPTVDP